MRRPTILNAVEVKRTTFTEAENAFYKLCKLKNLRPRMLFDLIKKLRDQRSLDKGNKDKRNTNSKNCMRKVVEVFLFL